MSVVISALIVISLVGRAVEFLAKIAPDFDVLWTGGWFPRQGEFSIPTIFVGSMIIGGIAMLVAAPLGLGSAIYLSEYAGPRSRRRLKPIVEILAGVPSIVIAFFAITIISPDFIKKIVGTDGYNIFNLAAAGIGVGILTIPLVATIAEDAPPRRAGGPAGGLLRARRPAQDDQPPDRVPGGDLGHRGGLDHRPGPRDRRNHGRGRGRRRNGRVAVHHEHLRARPDGDGRDGRARHRHRLSVVGQGPTFESLFFVGLLLFALTFTLNVFSERFVRRVEAAATDGGRGEHRRHRAQVERRSAGGSRDASGKLFRAALLLSLLLTLGLLLLLLGDVLAAGLPVFSDAA